MHIDFDNYEYNSIVNDILSNREFKKLEGFPHHSTNRLEHSKRVSFYAYKICKRFNLDYVSAARGGLLHDFFLNSYERGNCNKLLLNHPMVALYNSKKHFKLNEKEMDIILSHMFPVNIKFKPKYKESYVITFVDKLSCVYERFVGCRTKTVFNVGKTMIYMFLLFNN